MALIGALGGGGYYWIAQDRAERAREATRSAYQALIEAESLRSQALAAPTPDAAAWAVALQAAQQADRLAGSPLVDDAARGKSNRILAEVTARHDSIRKEIRQAALDRETSAELEGIPLLAGEDIEAAEPAARARGMESAYSKAFDRQGIDLAASPVESARRVREARRSRPDLRPGSVGGRPARLARQDRLGASARVALLADADAGRSKLREALFSDEIISRESGGQGRAGLSSSLRDVLADGGSGASGPPCASSGKR